MLTTLDITVNAKKKLCREENMTFLTVSQTNRKAFGQHKFSELAMIHGHCRTNSMWRNKSLTDFLMSKKNTTYEVFKFRQANQISGELIVTFYTILRTLVATCDFHDTD